MAIDAAALDRLAAIEGLSGLGPQASVTDRIAIGDRGARGAAAQRAVVFSGQPVSAARSGGARHRTGPAGVDLLDLYAGAGLFAMTAAAIRQARVTAVEGDRVAAADLTANAGAYADVAVHHQPVEEFLERAPKPAGVVIADPPRTGLSRAALDGVIRLRAGRVIYVSCDVATLARDARRLVDAGYDDRASRRASICFRTPHTSKRSWCSSAPNRGSGLGDSWLGVNTSEV